MNASLLILGADVAALLLILCGEVRRRRRCFSSRDLTSFCRPNLHPWWTRVSAQEIQGTGEGGGEGREEEGEEGEEEEEEREVLKALTSLASITQWNVVERECDCGRREHSYIHGVNE